MASFFIPKPYLEPSRMANGDLVLTDDSSNDYDDDVLSLEGSSECSVFSDVTTGTFASMGQTLYRMVDMWHVQLGRDANCEREDGTSSSSSPFELDLPEHPPHFSPLQTAHGLSISVVDYCSWQGPSLEVVPTKSVDGIMPLWRSEWTRDRAEWEERRKSLLATDLELERSRTHEGERIDSMRSNTPLDRRSQSDVVADRNRRVVQSIVSAATGNASITVPPSEVSTNEREEKWAIFVQEKEKIKFNEVVIESLALSMSVDEFYNHVLADDASNSLAKFMRDIGELNVDTSPWDLPRASAASESLSRTIHYTHPVNAPMAPPTAKARKQQILHKFGNAGLCVETCTIVEEVPMADCFVVEDRLWVHGAKDGSEGCVLSVTFQIRFVKGSMFRKIIENTTRKEYGVFFSRFAGMVRGLGKGSQEATIELEEAPAMVEGEKHLQGSKETCGINIQGIVTFAATYIRKLIPESDYTLIVACAAFIFMISLNIVTTMQMMMIDARLEKNDLNQAILLTLLGGKVFDGSCPN